MDENVQRRLIQMFKMSREGQLGEDVRFSSMEYDRILPGIPIFIKTIEDFYSTNKGNNEFFQLLDLFAQLIILVYRDSKKNGSLVSNAILHSFLKDFPETTDSCLYSRWETLIQASLAFKAVSQPNVVLIWEQAKSVIQAYNEFLSGLLGYFIVGWRCAQGKNYNTNVFKNSYGSKLNEFSQLTGGDAGAFYVIFRFAQPKLRNAIAHGDIWLDRDEATVKFKDGSVNHTLPLVKFMAFLGVGSNLGQAYLSAIASIAVLEEGTASDILKIPPHIVKMFRQQ